MQVVVYPKFPNNFKEVFVPVMNSARLIMVSKDCVQNFFSFRRRENKGQFLVKISLNQSHLIIQLFPRDILNCKHSNHISKSLAVKPKYQVLVSVKVHILTYFIDLVFFQSLKMHRYDYQLIGSQNRIQIFHCMHFFQFT